MSQDKNVFFTQMVVTVINSNIYMKLNMWACGKIMFGMKGTDIRESKAV